MGKKNKKPRNKSDLKQCNSQSQPKKKIEKDWSFDEIARSKTRRH